VKFIVYHNLIHSYESNYDVTAEVSETHKQLEQTLTIKGWPYSYLIQSVSSLIYKCWDLNFWKA